MATYSNIYIDQGSTYTSVIPVKDNNGLPLDLSDYSSRGQIRKSYSSNVKVPFTTSITSPLEGKVSLSLTASQTRAMKAGRYVYDVEIYNGSDDVIRIAEGQVEINPGISNSDIDIELPPVQTLSEIIDDRIDTRTVVVDKLLPLSAEDEARFYSNTNLTTRLQEKASTISPSFTGTPTSTTPPQNNNSTRIATTEYVLGQASAVNPTMNGTVAVGTSLRYARADHVHPTDTSRAPVASPSFTGNVTFGTGATITLPNNSITSAMIVNGTITDTDINSNADIAGSKILPNFGSGNIVTIGTLTVGHTTQFTSRVGTINITPLSQTIGTGDNSGALLGRFSADGSSARLSFAKSRSTTKGDHAIVLDGNDLGLISFGGSDGVKIVEAARIHTEVDGTPNVDDMPGRLIFSTTSSGAATPTERMRIDSSGISTLNNLKVGYSRTGAGISQIEIYSSAGASAAANSTLQRGSGDNGNFTVSDSGTGSIIIHKNNSTGNIIFRNGSGDGTDRLTITAAGAVELSANPAFSSNGNRQVATTNYVAQAIGAPVININSSSPRDVLSTDVGKYIRYNASGDLTLTLKSTLTGTLGGSSITFRRTTGAGVITLVAGEGVTINDNASTNVAAGKTFSIKLIDAANKIWDFID